MGAYRCSKLESNIDHAQIELEECKKEKIHWKNGKANWANLYIDWKKKENYEGVASQAKKQGRDYVSISSKRS